MEYKVCSKCGENLPIDKFYKKGKNSKSKKQRTKSKSNYNRNR